MIHIYFNEGPLEMKSQAGFLGAVFRVDLIAFSPRRMECMCVCTVLQTSHRPDLAVVICSIRGEVLVEVKSKV